MNNSNLLDIENIRKHVINKKVYWTNHCLNKLNQRNISMKDVKYSISNGKIIEFYCEDYPYPSCLIWGHTSENQILHTVCGVSENIIYIITAYYPNEDEWKDNMQIRRKESNGMF